MTLKNDETRDESEVIDDKEQEILGEEEDDDIVSDLQEAVTKEELQKILATYNKVKEERRELRKKNREARQELEQTKGKLKTFEDAQLSEEQRREQRLKELEEEAAKVKQERDALASRQQKLVDGLMSQMDAEIATWSDKLKKRDPGKSDPEKRIEWFESMREIAEDLKSTTPTPGNPALPDDKNKTKVRDVTDEEKRKEQLNFYRQRF